MQCIRCGLLLLMEILSDCPLVEFMSLAKMAEPVETLFGWVTRVGLRNRVLDRMEVPTGREGAILGVVWLIEMHCKA